MKAKNILINIFSVCFWITVWLIASKIVDLEILLPSPFSALKSLIALSVTSEFWLTCLYSVGRILSGLFIGAGVAVFLAALTYSSEFAYHLFAPVLTVIKSTPIASFIILALIWIGRDTVPTFITFLIVLPIVWSSTHHAMCNIDGKLKEMTEVFAFTKTQKIRHLYFPAVFTSFSSAFMTSVGIAWKAGVAAEVLCTPKYSIGTSIFESKKYIETPELFAWTATVILLSIVIEKILKKVCSFINERSHYD